MQKRKWVSATFCFKLKSCRNQK